MNTYIYGTHFTNTYVDSLTVTLEHTKVEKTPGRVPICFGGKGISGRFYIGKGYQISSITKMS